jgi:1-deoxy-D-xylulose-5-phosphate reductoisomerase
MMRSVALLGSTGSIGRQAIQVCAGDPDLHVCALAAGRDVDGVLSEAERLGVRTIALADPAAAEGARDLFSGRVLAGPEGVAQLAAESGADVVLNAVVGAAGLQATLAALESGVDVALANKESLVAGGPLVRAALERSGARLLPVDSEHSALQQLLAGEDPGAVEALVVTASGGPFRGWSAAELAEATPEQALRHPTWAMGARITIDSATLMNKGLEVIEAHWLFDVPFERIEVVVHPQSIVHALVRLRDGAVLAHLGLPDMRVPIAYALAHPRRPAVATPRLDLTRALSLTFEPPDSETFRCLALARAAGLAGGLAPCALNAADEEAVAAFLAGRCRFSDIPALVERALEACSSEPLSTFAQVREADAAARTSVREALQAGVPG